jgi:hypothetical protein
MDKIRSVDKIRLVQQRVYWMIVRSAKVGAGSGRGARKLGKFKFRSHQSGALQLRQHLTEQVAGQRFERGVGEWQHGYILGGQQVPLAAANN